MSRVTRMGGVIMPPVPAFYHMPRTIDELINQTVGKVLDLFSIDDHEGLGVKSPPGYSAVNPRSSLAP